MRTRTLATAALLALSAVSSISAQPVSDSFTLDVNGSERPAGGAGDCIVENLQGTIAAGFLGWTEPAALHAILIDPTGTGAPGDPGCAGSFDGQQFRLASAQFFLADGTAFGSPNGETGVGTTTYTVSVHPLATPGDPTAGPAPAVGSVQQVLEMDGTGTYIVTAPLDTVLDGPFFVAINFDDFDPDNEVASTLWDGTARPLGRQFMDNGGGLVDQTDFLIEGDVGWVDVTATGAFEPAGGPDPDPETQAVSVNSSWAITLLILMVAGLGLITVRRAI